VVFTDFSAVFVYKTHILTTATSHIVVFTEFSAVFVYKTHILTAVDFLAEAGILVDRAGEPIPRAAVDVSELFSNEALVQ
jgi:hypothetical protein